LEGSHAEDSYQADTHRKTPLATIIGTASAENSRKLMPGKKPGHPFQIHILETASDMGEVENLQRLVWPGNETDIIPSHFLIAAVNNGGVVIGAFEPGGFQSSFADETLKTTD
jgi:hypothetical protein